MLLDAILQMHAWASGRFKHKTQLEGHKLEDQNLRIIKTEAEQGMCSPTPSSSTSAFSFSSSFSKFCYRAIGIVGMLRLPFNSRLVSATCYLLFFWNWRELFSHCTLWFCQVWTAWSMLTIDYSYDIREGTRGSCRLCDHDEKGSGYAYWSWLGGLISGASVPHIRITRWLLKLWCCALIIFDAMLLAFIAPLLLGVLLYYLQEFSD